MIKYEFQPGPVFLLIINAVSVLYGMRAEARLFRSISYLATDVERQFNTARSSIP